VKSVWLAQIDIERFGPFRNRTFHFEKGLNLILGENGSGKTCLASVVPTVLFGKEAGPGEPLSVLGKGRIALEINHSRGRVRIERELETNRVRVEELGERGKPLDCIDGPDRGLATGQAGREETDEYFLWLEQFFGFLGPRDDIRENPTTAGRHSSGNQPVKMELDMAAGVLSGNLLEWLRDMAKNSHGDKRRRQEVGSEDLSRVHGRLKELEQKWFEVQERIDAFTELSRQIDDPAAPKESEIPASGPGGPPTERANEEILNPASHDQGRTDIYNEPGKPLGNGEQVEELLRSREDLMGQLSRTGLPLDLPEELPLILTDAADVRRDLVAIQDQIREFQGRISALRNSTLPNGIWFSTLIFLGGAAACWAWPKYSLYAILAAGGFLSVIWALVGRKQKLLSKTRFDLQSQNTELERRREATKAKQEHLQPRFLHIGLSPSPVEMVKMEKNLQKHKELRKRLSQVDNGLREHGWSSTGNGGTATSLFSHDSGDGPGATAGRHPFKDNKMAVGNIETRLEEKSLEELKDLLRRIEEEGEELHKEEMLRDRHDGSPQILTLWNIGQLLRENPQAGERLLKKIVGKVKEASSGRLVDLRFSETLELEALADEGFWLRHDQLSEGILAVIDLLLKATVYRETIEKSFPWLVFDEPMESMDGKRRNYALRTLEETSRQVQVIVATRDFDLRRNPRHNRWNFIELNESADLPRDERSKDVEQLHLL